MLLRARILPFCLSSVPKRSLSKLQRDEKSASQISSAKMETPMESVGVRHPPTNFDKRLLVLTRLYKSSDEIPGTIPRTQMEKCRNMVRVWGTAFLMLSGAIGALISIMMGKDQARRIMLEVEKSK